MSFKPDQNTLVAYVYGELEAAEEAMVEQYISTHPDARQTVEQLQLTRKALHYVEEKEVIAPPIFLDDDKRHKTFGLPGYMKTIIGIAASLMLLLVAARLLQTEVSYHQGELSIRFGTPPPAQDKPVVQEQNTALTAQQVQLLIDASLARNNEDMATRWDASQQKFEQTLALNLRDHDKRADEVLQTAAAATQDQLRVFVAGLQRDNLKSMQEYMQLTAGEQNKYVEGLLVDFSKYLQEQRNQDIQFFQTRMNSIERNTDQFKQETEQILAGIISTAGNRDVKSY